MVRNEQRKRGEPYRPSNRLVFDRLIRRGITAKDVEPRTLKKVGMKKALLTTLSFFSNNRILSLVFLRTRKTVEFHTAASPIPLTADLVPAHEPLASPEVAILRDFASAIRTQIPNPPELGGIDHRSYQSAGRAVFLFETV